MACLPLSPADLWSFIVRIQRGRIDQEADSDAPAAEEQRNLGGVVSSRLLKLQRSLFSASLAQGALSTLDFALNDPITGMIGCAIATMGTQAASANGQRYLPTYIVLTFCNGTMQVLLGLEDMGGGAFAASSLGAGRDLAMPLAAKLVQLIHFASPVLMFGGLLLAWHLHSEWRSLMALQSALHLQEHGAAGAAAEAGELPAAAAAPAPPGSFQAFSGTSHRLVGQQAAVAK